MKSKIVQIVADDGRIYGLGDNGVVYQAVYNEDPENLYDYSWKSRVEPLSKECNG